MRDENEFDLFESGRHSFAGLSVSLVGKKFVAFPSGEHHETFKFVAPSMGHEPFLDTEAVPGANGGINPNDIVFEGVWVFAVVAGTNLIQLSKTNGLIDSGGPLSIGVSVTFGVPSKRINMEKRA